MASPGPGPWQLLQDQGALAEPEKPAPPLKTDCSPLCSSGELGQPLRVLSEGPPRRSPLQLPRAHWHSSRSGKLDCGASLLTRLECLLGGLWPQEFYKPRQTLVWGGGQERAPGTPGC